MTIRDLFDDLGAPERANDPMRAAQRAMAPRLPRRFYRVVSVAAEDGGFAVQLDGKVPRTPRGQPLMAPARALADAMAAEWDAQGETIDPATMPLTRLVNVTLDAVLAERAAVRAEIVRYATCDLVCYRAAEPATLVDRQAAAWDPVLAAAARDLRAHFRLAQGIVHVDQPADSLAAVQRAVEEVPPFALGALSSMTTLAGSVLIALAVTRGAMAPQDGWAAAHVDEDWQADIWGADAEAAARRTARKREWDAAALVVATLCGSATR